MITKRIGNKEYKLVILYDDCAQSPREWQEEYSKMCIRQHGRYDFPNDLDFDFNAYDNGDIELPGLDPNQYIFGLDFYDHGSVSFSLQGEGTQCAFDTSKRVGFLIVTIEDDGEKSYGRATEIAQAVLKDYNSYLNGDVKEFIIEVRDVLEKDGKEFYSDWDNTESYGGYYGDESMEYDIIHNTPFTKEEIDNCTIKY